MMRKNTEAIENSINNIIHQYSDMVYKLAYARTKNKTDAEDLFRARKLLKQDLKGEYNYV